MIPQRIRQAIIQQLQKGVPNLTAGSVNAERASISETATRAFRSTDQTVSTNTQTKVEFDQAPTDSLNGFDTTNSKFVVQRDGVYLVSGTVSMRDQTDGDQVICDVFKNGSVVTSHRSEMTGQTVHGVRIPTYTDSLTANDEIDVRITIGSGDVRGQETATYLVIGRLG